MYIDLKKQVLSFETNFKCFFPMVSMRSARQCRISLKFKRRLKKKSCCSLQTFNKSLPLCKLAQVRRSFIRESKPLLFTVKLGTCDVQRTWDWVRYLMIQMQLWRLSDFLALFDSYWMTCVKWTRRRCNTSSFNCTWKILLSFLSTDLLRHGNQLHAWKLAFKGRHFCDEGCWCLADHSVC